MILASRLRSILNWLFKRREAETDLDRELESFIEMCAAEKTRDGVPPDEARRLARLELGGIDQVKERVRQERHGGFFDVLLQDIRLAMRRTIQNPGFSLIVAVTLAVGVGGMTAIFSVIEGVMLRPLPFANADRIVLTTGMYRMPEKGASPQALPPESDWPTHNDVFEAVSLRGFENLTMLSSSEPVYVSSERVSPNYLDVLQVKPLLGRGFTKDEGTANQPAMISYEFWQEHFGGEKGVIGREVPFLEGRLTIIGVMPRDFESLFGPVDLWTTGNVVESRPILTGVARLKPQFSRAQAEERLNITIQQIDDANPGGYHRKIQLQAAAGAMPDQKRLLLLLLAAVGAVFLIAIINIANLLLSRGITREREIAIRIAVGAGRIRLIRQFLTESVLLAAGGGMLGILLAFGLLNVILARLPRSFPHISSIYVDEPVLVFASAVTFFAAVLFGVLPALLSSRPDVQTALKEGARQSSESRVGNWMRSGLLAAEMALACVLLIAAAIAVRTFWSALDVPLGIDTADIMIAKLHLPDAHYKNPSASAGLRDHILARLRRHPEVESASFANLMPLAINGMRYGFFTRNPDGDTEEGFADKAPPIVTAVTAEYFQTLNVPVTAGRMFRSGASEIVVSETFARDHWPNSGAIGMQTYMTYDGLPRLLTVVGIVRDQNYQFFTGVGTRPHQAFYPCDSCDVLLVKGKGSVGAIIRQEVTAIDNTIPITSLNSLDDSLMRANKWANPRFRSTLFTAFSVAGLLMALAGAYGVTSYAASRRVREMGIRTALGASRRRLLMTLLGQSLIPVMIGVSIGLIAAWNLSRFATTFMLQIRPADTPLFLTVALVLIAAVAAANVGPIWRVTAADPLASLRSE